jgi:trehalose-6-phosphatase
MYDSFTSQNVQPELLMYPRPAKYNHDDEDKPYAIVADIDGTVARHVSRSPYDYTKVGEDEYIEDVCQVLNDLSYHMPLVFVSGRDDSCEADTRAWLDERFVG